MNRSKRHIIYMHTVPNGKHYIGQTSGKLKNRIGNDFKGYEGQVFYNAVLKYGPENIRTRILYEVETLEEANRLESLCIDRYGTISNSLGYNKALGGSKSTFTEESKKKLSKKNTEVYKDPALRKKVSNSVRENNLRHEVKKNRSSGLRNMWRNPEIRQSRIKASTSKEAQEKRTKSLKAVWDNDEKRKEQSIRMREALSTPEIRKDRSNRMTLLHANPEYKKKHSDAMKASWAKRKCEKEFTSND